MSGVLTKVFSALGGSLIEDVGNVVDKFVTTDAEKMVLKNETARIVLAHVEASELSVRAEMEAKSAVIVAEMQSGDNYTRRARPTVVYFGLVAIALNYVIGPWCAYLLGAEPPTIELPEEFWMAWGGVVAVWFIGRSAERRGAQNKIIGMVTG